MTAPTAFDLRAPLPRGTTVLEASAGTGKTYAIVSVAVRHIAEGVPASKLLMATFSNAASAELRDRMRTRLTECLAAFPASGERADSLTLEDDLVAWLFDAPDDEVAVRRRRLVAALSDFDAATVATTHTFCNRMLAALGFLGGREQQYPIVEDVDDIVDDVARDAYLARFAGDPDDAPGFDESVEIARAAVRNANAILAPTRDDERTDESDLRVRMAEHVRRQTQRRKRLARLRTYDDLQNTLFEIVTDPDIGELACARIRDHFEVVLIDEFQDTDPQQWEIVRRCFHGHLPLVLVGDPKQSIYAFRGAEVLSYLNAVETAEDRRLLTVNRRSDESVVDGLGVLFGGATFGHRDIAFHPVQAHHAGSRIHGAPAVRIRGFTKNQFTDFTKDGTTPRVAQVRENVIDDVAADIAALLASDTTIDVDGRTRRVEPGDIAVLLRANRTIEPLQRKLSERDVASVVTSGTSVFATDAARHWWHVLTAIDHPARQPRVRLAALTPLIGHTAESLESQGDTGIGTLAGQFGELGRVFVDGGFAAMAARLFDEFDTAQRILGSAGGERLLTDVRQVADVCNRRVADTGSGLSSIVDWLGEQVAGRSQWSGRGDATRRLDRDTAAVQIMTVHASKGLEFPIVYVPFGWDGATRVNPATFVYHEDDDERYLDVAGKQARGYARRDGRARSESAGEDLRLLYVAATRARSQLVLWWAPSTTTPRGALHRLLFTVGERQIAARDGGNSPIPDTVSVPAEDIDCVGVLRQVAAVDRSIVVEPAGRHGGVRAPRAADTGPAPTLAVARFTRRIDDGWRRTSYSAIVAAAHAAAHPDAGTGVIGTGSEPDVDERSDEPADGPDPTVGDADPTGSGTDSAVGTPSPMNGLPFGAGFGTLVHEVLEHVDTSVADIDVHVHELTVAGAARRGVDIDVDVLAAALVAVLTTPLGFGDLWSIGPRDRLAEMDFELPLSSVDGGFGLDEVGDLLARHLPADDLLAPYADLVRTVSGDRFRGFLTGSIDSVLRTPEGRFVVVDYKTNRLRPGDLAVEDFGRDAMAQEMMSAHYPLQALLYSVALHRYLTSRLPGYRPAEHLGPVQYHFVRGMAGPSTPPGCGVFEWTMSPGLVVAMSKLLAGEKEDRA
ncbi:UvrD-helicase domain-containing protein [Gordonia liuliyuniae]|uniref:RecBCD enzyme subunit RecB n=1 Tax=Gordonia liuliyuniae TaxID=2911517 RepID=A0ABS9IQD1_9ACTN|nr:UvrD-helicase domain-containing protein [Gordonia liuliyuniae]MCF8587752.1 UvrD-helicase domain-containing protein [Gordonia liuliyuniae]